MPSGDAHGPLVGRQLGSYQILGLLGAGGMGEVYRAHDTTLGRDIAFKILPAAFAADPDRLARFRREARILAALNDPHIASIYGFEETDGVAALVLELVEGPTLADRLEGGPLEPAEALAIARQIADALEAAHGKGIVHRDLKPANIKIAPTGVVKVLDFGLAKALVDDDGVTDRSLGSTVTSDQTRAGLILGSPAYMSPEQARGRALDKRTDVWSFGCVLFEMLAGRPAFSGETVSDTIAAIIEHAPDWRALPAHVPDGVRRLLARCLEKNPARRLHDIADARIEIEDAMSAPPVAVAAPRRWAGAAARPGVWAAIAAALASLAFALVRYGTPPEAAPRDISIHRLTDLAGLEEAPALSPDGRSVAFTAGVGGRRQIFVQLIAGGAPLRITRDPVDHQTPRWSRDSASILYFTPAAAGETQGTIREISALGGVPRRLIGSVGGADVNRVDGRLAFFRLADRSIELVAASPDGSDVRAIARFEPTTYYLHPRWSPDGKWVAFQRGDSVRFDVIVVAASGGEPRQLTRENSLISGFTWLPDSSGIVYSSSRPSTMPYLPPMSLWEVELDGDGLRQVTSGESSYQYPDAGSDGAVVVSRMQLRTDIWKFPVEGSPADNVRNAIRVTRQTGQVLTPTAGPGDREVAFLSDSAGHANLWVINTESGELRQITHERDPGVSVGVPVWSPDGRAIAFVYSRGNPGLTFGVWLVNPDGSNLRNIANPGLGPAWSHDGRWLYYSTRGGASSSDVVLKKVPAEGGSPVTVTSERLRNVIGSDGSTLYYLFERPLVDGTPEFEIRAANPEDAPFRVVARISPSRVPTWQIVNPALSPDGKWLAQALTDSFTTNIWALSTSTGEWRQITDFGDRATFIARRVSWSSDGRFILAAVGEGDADVVRLDGLLSTRPD